MHLGNKVWTTWFLHFLTSLQKIEILLDWDLLHEIPGIDKENLQFNYFFIVAHFISPVQKTM